MTPLSERILSKINIDADTGCWDWMGCRFVSGYGQIINNRKKLLTHRVSYEQHRGPIPAGMCVCHTCDNRACINPKHLFLGTNAENVADKVAKGRQAVGAKITANRRNTGARGTESGNAKLTDADVISIRAANGVLQRELAARYGVDQSQISNIRAGKRWPHLVSDKGSSK